MKVRTILTFFIAIYFVTVSAILSAIAGDKEDGTLLTLSVTETKEIEEDLLIAYMQYEHEGTVAREVQNAINKRMKQAMEMAKKVPEVKFSTEHYNIYKHYPNRRRNDPDKDKFIWRGSQSLVIKSTDSDKLLKLSGDMQDIGLLMNGLNFVVSPDKYDDVKDSLLETAIIKLRTKADRAARALGKDKVEFVSINVDNNRYYPQPMNRSYAMSADVSEKSGMSAPVAAPGQSLINLSVSAVVRIDD